MRKNYQPRAHSKVSCPSRLGERDKHGLQHKPVLVDEVIQGLGLREDGIYVDATFGRGGHSKAILEGLGPQAKLFALDRDPAAIKAASLIKDKRLCVEQGSFTFLAEWMERLQLSGLVNGILLDLGVSSPQLDEPERGFSFLRDGPLDMRMDPTCASDAASWVNSASYQEIAEVLKDYGEERYFRRIAQAIVDARMVVPITTTMQLADIVCQAHPRWEKHKHPATRVFQAIRIFINDELNELATVLEQCLKVLAVGGRLVVISFHSLEDRIVKRFIRKYGHGEQVPAYIPLTNQEQHIRLKTVGRAHKATPQEIKDNSRARSAVLRIAEKVA